MMTDVACSLVSRQDENVHGYWNKCKTIADAINNNDYTENICSTNNRFIIKENCESL